MGDRPHGQIGNSVSRPRDSAGGGAGRHHPTMPDPYARGRASCGVGFVAQLSGEPSHECVRRGVECLVNMDHRGAEGADEKTGDGAGIMLQLPDRLLRSVWDDLPEPGRYGVAMCFLPTDPVRRAALEGVLEEACAGRGLRVLGWRDVPVEPGCLGTVARDCMPVIRRLAVAADRFAGDAEALERRLYVVRRSAEKSAGPDLQIVSFSARTVVYKGMLRATQLEAFFPELCDERTESALALMHSRFSTNTFPSWELAHPYRMVAHNGEVNTLTGNRNWMRAREGAMHSELLGDELAAVLPVVDFEASDSATIDAVVELLVRAGRSAPHALKLLAPEALPGREGVSAAERGFVDFHSLLMEPWDGPAVIAFCDGAAVGATLDRNGLRPGRWLQTRDGWVVCASEAGTVAIDPADVVRRGRLEPGTILVADVEAGELLVDREVERRLAARQDYAAWHAERTLRFDQVPAAPLPPPSELPLTERQLAFGYSQEDLRVLIGPLVAAAKEPTGSMGADAALAALSDRAPSLFSYFKQLFAQVTNPAIDPVREEVVMSLRVALGRHGGPAQRRPRQELLPAARAPRPRRRRAGPDPRPRAPRPAGRDPRRDLAARGRRRRAGGGARAALRRGGRRGRRRRDDPDRLRPGVLAGARPDPLAAGHGGGPPPPGPGRTTAARGDRLRDRRGARDPPRRLPGRLRRRGRQPLPDAGVGARPARRGPGAGAGQGARRGPAQGDLEARHLDRLLLSRRPGLRGDRPRSQAGRRLVHRHPLAPRRGRDRGARGRGAGPPRPRLAGLGMAAAAGRRRLRLAPRRRAPWLEPGDGDAAAALDAERRRLRGLRGLPRPGRRRAARAHPARAAAAPRRSRPGGAGGGRAGDRDRQALRDRRDEPRLALAGGPRDAGGRDEPARRPLQHRRGRRGPAPLRPPPERRQPPLGDQAGRLRPLRGDDRLPDGGRPDPDQGRPGRQAGRGRPAPRLEGRPLHRRAPLRHPRGRTDLAAAPPRHLLDRGPEAADLRPALRQPGGRDLGQARRRGGGRDGRRRRRQGGRRPRHRGRPRRRHRRRLALLDPGGGDPLGAGDGGDAAGPGRAGAAQPHRAADRRRHADRARRRSSPRCSAPKRSPSRPPP